MGAFWGFLGVPGQLLDGSWELPGTWEGLPEGLMGAWRPREGEKKGPGGPTRKIRVFAARNGVLARFGYVFRLKKRSQIERERCFAG